MTYEQFWDGDIEIATMFRKAHEIKLDEANSLAWLQGSYVYQAVGALAPVLKAFCKGKAQPYLKEPYGKSQKKEIVSEIDREEAKRKRDDEKFNAFMTAWMSSVNKHMSGETNG